MRSLMFGLGALVGALTVATCRADILYTTSVGAENVLKYDASSNASIFGDGHADFAAPQGLAFDKVGDLFVADNTRIYEFSRAGIHSIFATTTDPLNDQIGLAFDAAGNLYATTLENQILRYTPDGTGSMFASTGLKSPSGLAFDSAGNLYAANRGNNTIEKFTPDGTASLFASTGLNAPSGLAFDGAGNLYAANILGGSGSIEKFTPGGFGSVFATTGLSGPKGLAFDSAGNLYVGNNNLGSIEKFTPAGVGSPFVAHTGTSFPDYLAFTDDAGAPLPLANQVPEPASVGAIVIVALALTRRRSRPGRLAESRAIASLAV